MVIRTDGAERDRRRQCMKKTLWIMLVMCLVVTSHAGFADAARGWHGGGHGGWHGGPRVGVYVGPGWGWGWPYYPYYYQPYYQPQTVIVERPTDFYVQPTPAPGSEEKQYWYYCRDPKGYYPYVKKCPKGWMKVVPPDDPGG